MLYGTVSTLAGFAAAADLALGTGALVLAAGARADEELTSNPRELPTRLSARATTD